MSEEFPSLLPLLQVDVFQEKQGLLQQIKLRPSNKPKKVCIRLCDTNNSTQCLTWMYHHIASEILYRLRGTKISRTPSRCVPSIWLYSFFHLSAMEDPRIIRGFFQFFPHKVSHHKVRKLMDLSFWKKFQISLA